MHQNSHTARSTIRIPSVRHITVTAVLSAIAFALMFLDFPIPMLIPSFIKMDISDMPALLGAFSIGPVYGIVIELLKNLLYLLIKGTSSAYVGELCNFLLGAVFAAVAGLIYQYRKTRKGALVGALLGAVAMAVFSVPINFYLVYPTYVVAYGMPMEAIIGMYQDILPGANSLFKCLVIFNLPFTFIKGMLDVLICWLIYKPLSPVLHGRK